MTLRRRRREPARLRLDPIACDGIGMCAHLAPRLVALDPWGYPLLENARLEGADRQAAQRAVTGCPRRALFLEPADRP